MERLGGTYVEDRVAVGSGGRVGHAGPAAVVAFGYAPAEGSDAPDFTLPSQEGSPVSLKDYRGKWVVLYFYPKDQTPGCSREAHNFEVDQPKYAAHNAVVLGVSVDSVDSHKKFCAKEGLNFKLLADTEHKVTDSYGSLTNLGLVKFAARHTFLIDPTGKIAKAYTSVDPQKHSAEVLAELDTLAETSDPCERLDALVRPNASGHLLRRSIAQSSRTELRAGTPDHPGTRRIH